jgi:glycosyltransferase involved in cell wall biosynthesis
VSASLPASSSLHSDPHQQHDSGEDLVCFSHLRWDFVYQRPQHLLSRAARTRRVFYMEEPVFDARAACMQSRREPCGVTVVTPHVRPDGGLVAIRVLLDFFMSAHAIDRYIAWYYTPMALQFTSDLQPLAVVYDCMDELSAFDGAPEGLKEAERALLARADLVLTGGHSLYESKRGLHPNVHEFPSSVDVQHFAAARQRGADPDDQAGIPGPRIGFFGVLDERLDRELLAAIAERCPGWHFILIGPVAKIDPATLPRAANVHYLGPKRYEDLPRYIAGWDVAMLPFARNHATRYISPTKTPEYLAAGKPVVSTSIADVVRPYGEERLVWIADHPDHFVASVRDALCARPSEWLPRADAFLASNSWDKSWTRISERVRAAVIDRQRRRQATMRLASSRESR